MIIFVHVKVEYDYFCMWRLNMITFVFEGWIWLLLYVKVEYDEQGCFLESPYLFGEDQKYAHYMQVSPFPGDLFSFFFFLFFLVPDF